MSLSSNIEHLAAAPGIVAVIVDNPGSGRVFRGAENWRPILDASLGLLDKTGEQTIRLVIGAHTVVLQKESGETVAVVLPTGHAIAKSLRRMIRRMARKDRGPMGKREAAVAAKTTGAPGPAGLPGARPATSSTHPIDR